MNGRRFTALNSALVLLTSSFFLAPAHSDTVTVTSLTREAHVEQLKALYVPQYEGQLARLMAIKVKAYSASSLRKSFDTVMEDFQDVTKTVYGAWADPGADADAAALYSEEEIGEFEVSIRYLEQQVAKIKTITCVKGKTLKKITDVGPRCPKGYVIKK